MTFSRSLVLLLSLSAATLPVRTLAAESGVDQAIKPGDDFFAYANGAWLKATTIPAGRGRWGARDEIAELTQRQLAAVIRDASISPTNPTARKVGDYHAAYLDVAGIEAKGLAPLQPLLQSVDAVQDKKALARCLGGQMRADVDPLNLGVFASPQLFGLAVEYGIHGEKNHFAYLLQGGLGLGDREQYLRDSPAAQALRGKYRDYIARMLTLVGCDRATERAAAVLALETEIARSHATPQQSANDHNADHHWSRADFASRAPGLDWETFFAAAGLAKQPDIVVWQPSSVEGAAALVAAQPLEVWRDYLRFHLADRYADVLPRSFAESALAFHDEKLAALPPEAARAQRAVAATNDALVALVSRVYVEKNFSPATKARVQKIADQMIDGFAQRIQAVTWMTPASKALALEKMKTLYFGAGYPDTWPDDSALAVDARDAFGNRRRAADWAYRNALAKLDQPVNPREWVIPPQAAGALLNFLQNSYNFSAALLQPPKFDPAASDAASYGAIGAVFAHDVCHFVDPLGADYDARGAFGHWWTKDDEANYEAAAQPLIAQFSGYRVSADLALNGKLTLSENIADLAGLSAAFDVYRRSLGDKAADKDLVRAQDREFFIAFARAWRAKATDAALRTQAESNDHAPEQFRVATVRNLAAWYEAFDVKPGDRLYLAPKDRVRIW